MTEIISNKDKEDRILSSSYGVLAGVNYKFELWSWDGIHGVSFIFDLNQIHDFNVDQLLSLIRENIDGFEKKEFSSKKTKGKLFINTGVEELFD
jgi:hypothetical protein